MSKILRINAFLLEFAAIVFLVLTAPFWLPIALGLGAIALVVIIVVAIVGGLLALL